MDTDLSYRLQLLFDKLYPAGGSPYTVAKVAELASTPDVPVTAQQIHGILNGKTHRPSFATIVALANFFNVPLEYFSTTDEDTWKSYESHILTLHERINDTSLLAARTSHFYSLREQRRRRSKKK
uniref:helix-turn-helix domain-containing protein n=1 Tax=Corynebacterium glutamicum TaxID=1718 RepID=UPI00096369E3|nr:helix-turn-helix transcriptional regulator [Corynebacterium glutamicum]